MVVTGMLKLNEPLAPLTSWHIGGPAERYYRPSDSQDLKQFLSTLPRQEPLTWLGLGSNVLIADEGLAGTVIHTLGMGAKEPEMVSDPSTSMAAADSVLVRVESGLPCAKLAKFCAKNGLIEAEFLAGIPGTIGGALSMNAGAYGGETWGFVEKVEVVDRFGKQITRLPQEYKIAYRSVECPAEEWFIAGYFKFQRGDATQAAEHMKQLLRRRNETQPIGRFSCGSVFRNPPNQFAAQLIESADLKGYRIRDAEISTKHANFIINHGHATAADVLALIQHIQASVWELHKVHLHPEVRLLGFK